MKLNADFDKRVVIHSEDLEWLSSPMPGVSRRPLDRIGDEVARATSIVRYKAGSKFSPHVHTGGEEFFVLEGVFQDEHGDFPAGSYIRNPPQSSHTPGSEQGCVIFVKLWQFQPSDRTHVRLNSNYMRAVSSRDRENVSITPLYADQFEEVSIETWEPNSRIYFEAKHGAELLVIDGGFTEGDEILSKHSWLRLPKGSQLDAQTADNTTIVWIKRGHLTRVAEEAARLPI